jgi:hypothetical protein
MRLPRRETKSKAQGVSVNREAAKCEPGCMARSSPFFRRPGRSSRPGFLYHGGNAWFPRATPPLPRRSRTSSASGLGRLRGRTARTSALIARYPSPAPSAARLGEVSERSKERDWKSRTCRKVRRGFKSLPLRHFFPSHALRDIGGRQPFGHLIAVAGPRPGRARPRARLLRFATRHRASGRPRSPVS